MEVDRLISSIPFNLFTSKLAYSTFRMLKETIAGVYYISLTMQLAMTSLVPVQSRYTSCICVYIPGYHITTSVINPLY